MSDDDGGGIDGDGDGAAILGRPYPCPSMSIHVHFSVLSSRVRVEAVGRYLWYPSILGYINQMGVCVCRDANPDTDSSNSLGAPVAGTVRWCTSGMVRETVRTGDPDDDDGGAVRELQKNGLKWNRVQLWS